MRQELNSINYIENYINSMFKIIIVYELIFVAFWNILYYSNSGIENWFQEKILTAIFVFLSTMALGLTLIYAICFLFFLTFLSFLFSLKESLGDFITLESLKDLPLYLFDIKIYLLPNSILPLELTFFFTRL